MPQISQLPLLFWWPRPDWGWLGQAARWWHRRGRGADPLRKWNQSGVLVRRSCPVRVTRLVVVWPDHPQVFHIRPAGVPINW